MASIGCRKSPRFATGNTSNILTGPAKTRNDQKDSMHKTLPTFRGSTLHLTLLPFIPLQPFIFIPHIPRSSHPSPEKIPSLFYHRFFFPSSSLKFRLTFLLLLFPLLCYPHPRSLTLERRKKKKKKRKERKGKGTDKKLRNLKIKSNQVLHTICLDFSLAAWLLVSSLTSFYRLFTPNFKSRIPHP